MAAENGRFWTMAAGLIMAGLLLLGGLAGCSAHSPHKLERESELHKDMAYLRPLPAASVAADDDGATERRAALDEALGLVSDLKYAQAAARLRELVPVAELAGDDATASEALFWLGYCAEKQGDAQQAEGYYERVNLAYPKSRAAQQARLRLRQLKG